MPLVPLSVRLIAVRSLAGLRLRIGSVPHIKRRGTGLIVGSQARGRGWHTPCPSFWSVIMLNLVHCQPRLPADSPSLRVPTIDPSRSTIIVPTESAWLAFRSSLPLRSGTYKIEANGPAISPSWSTTHPKQSDAANPGTRRVLH